MSFDGADIERIVAQVMDRLLTSTDAVRSQVPTPAEAPSPRDIPVRLDSAGTGEASNVIRFVEPVITAELLQSGLNGAKRVQFGQRAILTPSARDFLRSRQIEWVRQSAGAAENRGPAASGPGARWQAVISKANSQAEAVVKNLQAGGFGWERHVVGLPVEAARHAVSAICRGEAAGIAVFADQPEAVACLANRNSKLRAATASNAQTVTAAKQSLGINLLAINPAGKSFFELRTMLQAFTTGGPPKPPAGWEAN